MNWIFSEARMFWLSDGEEIMTLALFVLSAVLWALLPELK